jgi:hypothetical protein
MSGFKSPNHTQIPNDFFEMIPNMSEAELRVTLIMLRETRGWHRDAAKVGKQELADRSGLSFNGVTAGCEDAEIRGTFRRTNPDKKTKAEWELVEEEPSASEGVFDQDPQPVRVKPSTSEGQVRLKESKEIIKQTGGISKNLPMDWKILAKLPITEEDLDKERLSAAATQAFEEAARVNPWPWGSDRKWEKFHKWVIAEYAKDHDAFARFFKGMRDDGKFAKWSPDKIRLNPQPFMDTGWPQFSNPQASDSPYRNYTKERLEKEG